MVRSISTLNDLRRVAVCHSLFAPTGLKSAIRELGFVQADPIRSPARAQDLILRPRVKGYRAGDLEREYASLELEEDYLYAYGFLPRLIWRLLHPRNATDLPAFESRVLNLVRLLGQIHPADLKEHLGAERVVNAWGGYSKATTRALDDLHYRGLLRIAGRDKGIRIFEATARQESDSIDATERLKKLVLLLAKIFAPALPLRSLYSAIQARAWLLCDASFVGGFCNWLVECFYDNRIIED